MDISTRMTARQIRQLPADVREVILQTAAALAEEEYRTNQELEAFEAFGEKDLFVDVSSTISHP